MLGAEMAVRQLLTQTCRDLSEMPDLTFDDSKATQQHWQFDQLCRRIQMADFLQCPCSCVSFEFPVVTLTPPQLMLRQSPLFWSSHAFSELRLVLLAEA